MLTNIISAMCFCYEQQPEKKTIHLNTVSKSSNNHTNSITPMNTNYENEFCSSTNYSPLIPNMNSQKSKNGKSESPVKKCLNKNQSCKVNVKIKNFNYEIDEKKKKLYKKIKTENQYFDDNNYFNNFILNIDNLIQENLKRETISESDDLEINSKNENINNY